VGLSAASAMLMTFKLAHDWDLRVSSVRWLFVLFFAYLSLYAGARFAHYMWVLLLPAREFVDGVNADPLSYSELDQLGVYAALDLAAARTPALTAILCVCDVMHFGTAFWVLPLTHELAKIAAKSMDRGAEREKRRIGLYAVVGHVLIAAFLAAEVAIAVHHGGYSVYSYRLMLAIYIMQITTLAYMASLLIRLKRTGRDMEPIHGHFEVSPVYTRLKRIMYEPGWQFIYHWRKRLTRCSLFLSSRLVYLVFALQFEVASLYAYTSKTLRGFMLHYIAISQVVYNATGLMLALVTGCSLPCFLRTCACFIPADVEAQLAAGMDKFGTPCVTPVDGELESHLPCAHGGSTIHGNAPPPVINPVFVVTDIESSSALWAIGDGRIMQQATEVHDDVLRSLLAPHRGYEITTAGDSFQLAFHTIREAVSYCLAVQTKLLTAKWPAGLNGLVPATKKQRVGHRLLFRGLRVRMGVHDAMGSDGALVNRVHAVTGKMTYTGASEVIAAEVSDLAVGGQVLVTKRIADWLLTNKAVVRTDYGVHYLCDYSLPQVDAHLEIFQVVPTELSRRLKAFGADPTSRLPGGNYAVDDDEFDACYTPSDSGYSARGSITSIETISTSLHDRL
jgi:class 3 adenylate cyclase